mmetsp:Transcript_51079/g.131714  ORF Transcript_51079/g.131714 Transcript_51079/m.131714 type:complete len:1847 (+) Transcript_51079:1-5541(+)
MAHPPRLREPMYEVQARKLGYNPNNYRSGAYPVTRHDAMARHIEKYAGTTPYLECVDGQDTVVWERFQDKLHEHYEGQSLGECRQQWARRNNKDMLWELNEHVRRGIPSEKRRQVWLEIARADEELRRGEGEEHAVRGVEHAGTFEEQHGGGCSAVTAFQILVDTGRMHNNDALLQLQEDTVAASAWEESAIATMRDMHLDRLKRAQDICIALIAFSMDEPKGKAMNYAIRSEEGGAQVAYSEGLLVVAFFLIIAFEGKDGRHIQAPNDPTVQENMTRAFWLLYTITGSPHNQQFRDYYGCPMEGPHQPGPQLTDRVGPMEDVHRLSTILARYEPELWVAMNALGFHLSTVFYGAFARLFGFLLPTASLFRFWDLLFSDDWSPPHHHGEVPRMKPPRHALIDLAYGCLKHKDLKPQILQCCSAMEVRDCIVHFFENLYDPTEVLRISVDAERELWDYVGANLVEPMHVVDYKHATRLWDAPPQHGTPPGHLFQYRHQNAVLRELAYSNEAVPTAGAATADQRVTTKNVSTQIIPNLLKACDQDSAEKSTYGGMMRQAPAKIREIGPQLDQTLVGSLWAQFARLTENILTEDMSLVMALSVPPFPKRQEGEPTHMDDTELSKIVSRAGLGNAWNSNQLVSRLYQAFMSPWQRRMSLNEFFVALICCSKGTVGDKAMGLFHLYGHHDTPSRVPHCVSESHAASVIIEKIEGAAANQAAQFLRPPKDSNAIKESTALHFRVHTHSIGSEEMVLGEVFVPSLRPFIWSGTGKADNVMVFTIWGMQTTLPPGVARDLNTGDEGSFRNPIGQLKMSVKWIVQGSGRDQAVGQLGVHIHSLKFEEKFVEAPQWKNPHITLVLYDESRNEQQIKRWDPRSSVRRGVGYVTADIAYGGAFGDYMQWEPTMRRDPLGYLHQRVGAGHHGWDSATEEWVWSNKWGDQYSTDGLQVRKEFVRTAQAASRGVNTISLKACRHIVKNVLSRGLHTVTNRQASLIADQVFNRAGVVPGIIDAYVVAYDQRFDSYNSVTRMKEECDAMSRRYVDVRHQVVIAHEMSVDFFHGELTLFPSHRVDQNGRTAVSSYHFADMKIQDPFPGQRKILWIRYVRAGDGMRQNMQIQVDGEGHFPPADLYVDMDHEDRSGNVQMSVTKAEFVTCILQSPLLSETLRKLTTTDNRIRDIRPVPPLKLEVSIADPTGQEEDEDFLDAVNVRQRVLFEIWDHDTTSKDDFLGECWLPALNQLTPQPKQFVLEVVAPPPKEDEGSRTRPDARKYLKKEEDCKGHLFIEASWTFPEVPEEELTKSGESREDRVALEKKLHTGKLKVKIIKAEGIRGSDSSSILGGRGKTAASSDAYVYAYVQNEMFNGEKGARGFDKWGWRMSQTAHTPIMQTPVVKNSINPEWNHESEVKLMTGRFEKTTLVGSSYDIVHRQRNADQQQGNILQGSTEDLKLYFGAGGASGRGASASLKIPGSKTPVQYGETPGYRHGIMVFLGESIHTFKKKLQMACKIEAEIEKRELQRKMDSAKASGRDPHNDPEIKGMEKFIGQLEAVKNNMSVRHAVMVFSPSAELRKLPRSQESGNAFQRQWRLEQNDPSSWQPLDPIRTFGHYGPYGFGMGLENPTKVRITEGTDDYKLRNTRFRQFEEEQAKWAVRQEDLNDENKCWGYAKYTHPDGTAEWRQCIAERSDGPGDSGRRRYQVTFLHSPLITASTEDVPQRGPQAMRNMSVELDEESLLLGPANPKILASASLEHREFLAKAKTLQAEGRSEQEIVTQLNAELRLKWQEMQEKEEKNGGVGQTAAPPSITAADVRLTLQREDAAAAAGGAADSRGSPGTSPVSSPKKSAMLSSGARR